MVQLAQVGGAAGVYDTLVGVMKIEKSIARLVTSLLIREADQLAEGQFQKRDINDAWFGRSWSGSIVGHHSGLAHRELTNSILEAVAAMQHIEKAINQFEKQVTDTDEASNAEFRALLRKTEAAVDSMDGDMGTRTVGGRRGRGGND